MPIQNGPVTKATGYRPAGLSPFIHSFCSYSQYFKHIARIFSRLPVLNICVEMYMRNEIIHWYEITEY